MSDLQKVRLAFQETAEELNGLKRGAKDHEHARIIADIALSFERVAQKLAEIEERSAGGS